MSFARKKSRSNNNSPRDDSSPRIKILGSSSPDEDQRSSSPSSRNIIVCPRCKTSADVVRLGMWKEHDATVYFCGLFFPDERACRNVWMPDAPHIQLDEVNMRYLPGPDGDYLVTFK